MSAEFWSTLWAASLITGAVLAVMLFVIAAKAFFAELRKVRYGKR
jgi:hypothetical protein